MQFSKKILKDILKATVYYYVRVENQIEFLEKLYRLTNDYGGSTLWGVVQDLLEERKRKEFVETDLEYKW